MTKKSQKYGLATLGLVIGLLLAACGDATTTTAPATTSIKATTTAATTAPATTAATTTQVAASSTPTTAAVAATLPPGAKAVKAGSNSKEYTLLKAVVPTITATLDALKKGDVAGAKKAFEEYSNAWNGIEVYINSRSRQLYDVIEVQNEFKANELFEKAGSKAEDIIPFVEGVQKGYNEALKLAETGPDYDAILDEIADIRIVRIDLRKSIAALTTGDIVAGQEAFEKFDEGWDNIESSIKPRSKELYVATEKDIDRVSQIYKADKPLAVDLLNAENTLLTTYNRSLTMLNTIRTTGKVPAKEVILLQGVSPSLSATLTALKKPDLKAATSAFEDYTYGWSGIELYVKTRSAQAYSSLEDSEGKIEKLLEGQTPNPIEIVPLVEGLQKSYTDAINAAVAGQPLNPILDEVADMRILQTTLAKTLAALKQNDTEAAKAAYKEFDDGWFDVEQSVSSRNKTVYKDIEDKMTKVGRLLLRTDNPEVAEVTTAITELQTSYSSGLKLLTDAVNSGSSAAVKKLDPITGAEVDTVIAKVSDSLKAKSDTLVKNTAEFVAAVKARDLTKAKATYQAARYDYESIEFLAEAFSELDVKIDARPDDYPKGENDPGWTGFHPLEKAIFADGKLAANTDKLADQLITDVTTLRDEIKALKIDATVAIAGAAELIEEIQAGKITGEEERYSHTDLNDFRANFVSAKFVYENFAPFVKQRNAILDSDITASFADIEKSIAPYFDAQGKLTTDYTKVDEPTRKVLAQKIEVLADFFSRVAGTLGLKA